MSVYDTTFDQIIGDALHILFEKGTDIFTFALYYDHESHTVSVCADTRGNSLAMARQMNEFSAARFRDALAAKDLDQAGNWARVAERSYALGDFSFVSLGWQKIKAPSNSAPFFLAMIRALQRNAPKIAALSRYPESLVFCCSSKNSEVGFTWLYQIENAAPST